MDALGARRCCRSKREVIESRGSCVRNMREIDRYRRAADPRFQCLSALAFPRCPVKQDRLPDTVALTLRQGSRATSCTTCASRQVRTMRRSVTRPPRGVTDCGSTGGGIHPGSPIRATSTGGRGTASCCGRGAVSRRWACCRNAAWGPVPMRAPPFRRTEGTDIGSAGGVSRAVSGEEGPVSIGGGSGSVVRRLARRGCASGSSCGYLCQKCENRTQPQIPQSFPER